MKRWLILFSFLLIVSAIIWSVFNFNSTPAQAGVSVSAHVASICGNDILEEGEQCDTSKLADKNCVSLGYVGGTLSCYPPGGLNECTFNVTNCTAAPPAPPGGGGGGGGGAPSGTNVILQGKAYPSALITILYDGRVATTIRADTGANFKAELTTLTAGIYNFSLWAEDKGGRKSITFSFTVTVTSGMTTTISGIFLPPTIDLNKVNLLRGETLKIIGQTAPESELTISIESPQEIVKKTTAENDGDWLLSFDTSILDEGSHTTRVKAESSDGLLSSFSKVLGFFIGKYGVKEVCARADFNKDGKTNLTDFSIMLFWWGKYNPCVDQNQDGIVNLPDFSILMYYWSG